MITNTTVEDVRHLQLTKIMRDGTVVYCQTLWHMAELYKDGR